MNRIVNMILRQLMRQMSKKANSKIGGNASFGTTKGQKEAIRVARRMMKF